MPVCVWALLDAKPVYAKCGAEMGVIMKKYRLLLAAFLVSAILTSFCVFDSYFHWGTLENLNYAMEDFLFQRPESLEERKIVILGIDQEALDFFGPLPWTRDIYGDAIAILNEDPDHSPSVIGIDVLFNGYKDEDSDSYLAETAGLVDNVVVSSIASFTSEIENLEDGSFYVNDFVIENYEEPYEELKSAASSGFTNCMLGRDGIVRNGQLSLKLPSGEKKDSFSYQIYKKYAEQNGLPLNLESKIKTNSRYQWYLPFSSYPEGYEEHSIASLFTGELAASELEGLIVLIGAYAQGLQDSFFTAADHSVKMYGVEIHANMIQAMIDQNFKKYASQGIQFFIFFFVIAGCIIAFRKLTISLSTLLWLLAGIGYIVISRVCYGKGLIIQVIYIPFFVTAVYVAEVGINYVIAAREKQRTLSIFKRYAAPQVVDEIMRIGPDALELGGKMTDIACLFVDIRGFTPMSEALKPPQVVDVLNTYLTLTNDCIMKNQGTLDKFIGDATMAIYNAPIPLEDYIFKAVKTAWDMKQKAEELGMQLKEKYGREVSFGIGVHCGQAVVGNIGTKMRMDYTAIGDTVNTAARLESNAKAGEILISKDVYEALKGRIEVTSYGTSIKLKGKSDSFEIFRVDGVIG